MPVAEVPHKLWLLDMMNGALAAEGCGVSIAQAVCPAALLFNHSCSPNVTRSTEGHRLVFRGSRPIEEGAALWIMYGEVANNELQRATTSGSGSLGSTILLTANANDVLRRLVPPKECSLDTSDSNNEQLR